MGRYQDSLGETVAVERGERWRRVPGIIRQGEGVGKYRNGGSNKIKF